MIHINKIYIDKEDELDAKKLGKIMRKFRDSMLPELKRRRGYYDGSGQEIMNRVYADPTKPNNKIVKNYCLSIVDNYRGYICGKPITYAAKNQDDNIDALLECFKDNDVVNSDSEWLKNALVYGIAPQLCYINENNEKRFKNVSPESVIPIYSADLDETLLYVVYFYPVVDWEKDDWDSKFSVNVYDANNIVHYTSSDEFNSFQVDGEPEQAHFGEVPWSIFYLNDDGTSIFDCIITLQDAYNKILSDATNDIEAFCDAYMVISNATMDDDDIAKMKSNRVILSSDDMSVEYLTKNSSDTQVMNLLEEVTKSIHTISNSPDFSSEEFGSGVSSGIALQFKLVGMNNIATNIEAQFKKALQKRIDLLNKVFNLVDTSSYEVEISFTHNLPDNISDIANTVNSLRGLVSDETLLSQLPFISDVAQELERIEAQNEATASLYGFNNETDREDEADEGGDSNDN